jgi:hypothetical protein
VVSFGGALLGQTDDGYAAVRDIVGVAGHEDLISDIVLELVDDDEAERLSKVMVEAEIDRQQLQRKLLAKRMQKRARRADYVARRYGK